MANTRWQICKLKYGSHMVRERNNGEVIGSIIPYRANGGLMYLSTRVDGSEREFASRWDAAYWLMQAFDSGVK